MRALLLLGAILFAFWVVMRLTAPPVIVVSPSGVPTAQQAQAKTIGSGDQAQAPSAPTASSSTNAGRPTAQQQARDDGLSPQTVYQWCQGTECAPGRFEQLVEAGNVVNPYGVHMITGRPVS